MSTIKKVVESGYCVGCGACAYATKSKMTINKYGEYEPEIIKKGLESFNADSNVEKVCPFLSPDLNENVLAEEFLDGKDNFSSKIGFYNNVLAGHVNESEFRKNGTSGGTGTWIGAELLKLGYIDGVIHVKKNKRLAFGDPFYKYAISNTLKEIQDGAKTKYHVVEVSEVLELVKDRPGKYLFIGVPCLVKAIRRIQLVDPVIKESLPFLVSLVCGHFKSINWTLSLGWAKGIHPKDLSEFQYRTKGDNIPARKYVFRAQNEKETIQEDSSKVTGGKFNQGALMLSACNFCDDVVGETADLTIGDAWLPQFEADDNGTNLLIVRNKILQNIFEVARSEGRMTLVDITEKDAIDSQSGGFRQRREGLSYRLSKKQSKGEWYPEKRIQPNQFSVSMLRKMIYTNRAEVSDLTRASFLEAIESDNYNIYKNTVDTKIKKLMKLELSSIFFKALNNKISRKIQKYRRKASNV
ncbi:Coenzyme F420 hydrogenase/dehydrogenase, beta subunit C-terminal domain [Aquimarina agarivorans]|uniref:Coenzyme F420 hydrogenase/dehydrogenase, beta subunit C-terminal domain n=1 Tax=Aquimarina agarivorans TaxID=980584 RepID=UPI000248EB68|nr:Coenzyme F420 hydrogenase/dehydrogenase, beta subunit C-terminal domain [Aquimarina agarivorans]